MILFFCMLQEETLAQILSFQRGKHVQRKHRRFMNPPLFRCAFHSELILNILKLTLHPKHPQPLFFPLLESHWALFVVLEMFDFLRS